MQFQTNYYPGILADIVGTHARYYAQAWSFGSAFEAKVSADLASFLINRFSCRFNCSIRLLQSIQQGDSG